jgi:hypothetical protein
LSDPSQKAQKNSYNKHRHMVIQTLLGRKNSLSSSKTEFTFAIRIDHIENVPAYFQAKVSILVRINTTIVGKTEFRVVTTNTGVIKYNQTFEFECSLQKNARDGTFEPKHLSFDVLVKKAKIDTVSRNHKLNLSDFASLNRQVTEKEIIDIRVHEDITVPLTVMIGAVPASIGRRGKSLDLSFGKTRKSTGLEVDTGSPPTNPLSTYLPPSPTPPSSTSPPPSQSSTTAINNTPDLLLLDDTLFEVPTPSDATPTSANRSSGSGFASIARRRATVSSSATTVGVQQQQQQQQQYEIQTPSSSMGTDSSDIFSLQRENESLRNEVQSLKAEIQRLRQENTQFKDIVENPFMDYSKEEEAVENPFHLHCADTIDSNSIDVDSFF